MPRRFIGGPFILYVDVLIKSEKESHAILSITYKPISMESVDLLVLEIRQWHIVKR